MSLRWRWNVCRERPGRSKISTMVNKATANTLADACFKMQSGHASISDVTSSWWSWWEISIERWTSLRCEWSFRSSIEWWFWCGSWSKLWTCSVTPCAHNISSESNIVQASKKRLLVFRKKFIAASLTTPIPKCKYRMLRGYLYCKSRNMSSLHHPDFVIWWGNYYWERAARTTASGFRHLSSHQF